MKNLLTVDLEDWFSVEPLLKSIPRETWKDQISVVKRSTREVLDLFDKHDHVKATFFVLGWIADQYPDLIQEVADRGHEIACHSYYHRMVSSLTPDEFKRDTDKAINAIVKACSRIPLGYRSPSWGIRPDMSWAFEILADFGFEYDSSISPIKHDIYGHPTARKAAYEIVTSSGKTIVEIPASTIIIQRRIVSIGGGGWFRQHPSWFTRWGIRKLNGRGMPVVIYFHPWELDRELPEKRLWTYRKKKRGSLKNWARQYMGNITMKPKLEKLLRGFEFGPIKDSLDLLQARRKELI